MNRFAYLFAWMMLLPWLGCSEPGGSAQSGTQASAGTQKKFMPIVTEEQAVSTAKKINDLVDQNNFKEIEAMIDWEYLGDLSVSELKMNAREKADIKRGLMTGAQSRGLFSQVGAAVAAGGSYRFIKVGKFGDNYRPVYRMLNAGGGLNYHALELTSNGPTPRIGDLLVAATGEMMSATLRTTVESQLSSRPGMLEIFAGKKDNTKEDSERFQKMAAHAREGRYEEALKVYEQLPKNLKEAKLSFIVRMTSLSQVGTAEQISAASEEYARLFPGDASMALMLLDGAYTRKDLKELNRHIQTLIETYGDKEYLGAMYASACAQFNEKELAMKQLDKLDMSQSDDASALELYLSAAITIDAHDKTLATLQQLYSKLDWRFNDLTEEPNYKSFVESPEFEKWKTFLKNQPAL